MNKNKIHKKKGKQKSKIASSIVKKIVKVSKRLGNVPVQADIADQYGISQSTVSNILNGKRRSKDTAIEYKRRNKVHGNAVLTKDMVLEIRRLASERLMTQSLMAHRFKISTGTVSNVINRKSWKHV